MHLHVGLGLNRLQLNCRVNRYKLLCKLSAPDRTSAGISLLREKFRRISFSFFMPIVYIRFRFHILKEICYSKFVLVITSDEVVFAATIQLQ
jgi:hypothetical protein